MFVKPTINDFCFVVVGYDAGICLGKAVFAESAKELNQKIVENISGVEIVEYDVTVFMQEGKELREMLYDKDVSVRCYKPKQPLDIRIAAQSEWLKENLVIDPEYENDDYIKFIELLSGYSSGYRGDDYNTIAVDILSDVAKYYRRLI